MSPGTSAPRGEGRLVRFLLFPLRAIERARGWRRVGLLGLYAAVMIPVLAAAWRRAQLAGLPDVGDVYGTPASQRAAGGSDDRNAFVLYQKAARRYREMNRAEGKSFSKADHRWSAADATFRGWVADNREAVGLLREGSKRPEASLSASNPVEQAEVVQRISWIADAALFEAGRLREEGDPVAAWATLRAAVRASRDMERALPTSWTQTTAMTTIQFARGPVAEWAKDRSVDVAMLRRALDDLVAIESLTPPLSQFYRGEYRAADRALENPGPMIAERARHLAEAGSFDLAVYAPSLDAYLRGEPERSRRILRLLAVNDLAWCDRPAFDRPEMAVPRLRIYRAASAPPEARAISPEDLARLAATVLFDPAPGWRTGDLEKWDRNDRWSMGQLLEGVAVELYAREMGHPPASAAEALRRYRPIPGDSPDRDESRPLSDPDAPRPSQ